MENMETETLSEKLKRIFSDIIVEDLPEHLQFEIQEILNETNNFTEEEYILEAWEKNFYYLYKSIEIKYPTALRSYVPPEPEPEPEPVVEEPQLTAEQVEKIKKARELAEQYLKKDTHEKV